MSNFAVHWVAPDLIRVDVTGEVQEGGRVASFLTVEEATALLIELRRAVLADSAELA